MTLQLPRHVRIKRLKSGATSFYYEVPTKYRNMKCPVPSEPLGSDFAVACEKSDTLNRLFDEWDQQRKGQPIDTPAAPKIGTVDWLFREYKQSLAYTKKVAIRSRRDYEWAMSLLCDTPTKSGDRVGSRPIRTITPRGADKLYQKIVIGPNGRRDRTAEKVVKLCRKAWRVVHRLFPDEFPKDVPNPWLGVTLESRVKKTKPAVTRDEVYDFAHGCIAAGEPEVAAVAVICFEWLQRPENVIAGHIKWTDYRAPSAPTIIRVAHHKTGTVAPHPLEEGQPDGTVVKFYADAEEVLAAVPRRGVSMILREVSDGIAKPFAFPTMQHKVQRLRKKLGLPAHFTLDACRHGGMTELEEAELTDGQGRALSTHKTQQSYEGYAKRTAKRMLSATRKRHAHRLAEQNEPGDSVRNEAPESVRNGTPEQRKIST
ncbi:hypothetical protein IVB14_17625 [Bradyrhizobium sp. 180]|uniref:hypothetical protein n=1 Tax=Bradyrhizobium sp. 180 TaxID=2782650 RepID=UPI001FFA6524|nr:hypothetical protein [Bradyrhizobium sp. 180]MCK1492191.1 hypothetical protein [Bradyrhizobium sp. 180]